MQNKRVNNKYHNLKLFFDQYFDNVHNQKFGTRIISKFVGELALSVWKCQGDCKILPLVSKTMGIGPKLHNVESSFGSA